MRNSILPFNGKRITNEAEAKIAQALLPNAQKLTISGHGIIYGAHALKAIREFPELATSEIVDGICALLELTRIEGRKHRYYGVENYLEARVEDAAEIPEYRDIESMIERAFIEAKELYRDGYIGENYYYFTAEKLHAITLAHAIATLWDLGYREMAREAFAVHRLAVHLNRMTPPEPEEFRVKERIPLNPYQATYWRRDTFDDHGLKLAVAALDLLDRLPKEKARQIYNVDTFWSPFMR